MKIKGSNIPRNSNPANPLKEKIKEEKKKTYYVDLDGTLATYDRWDTIGNIGEPIPNMKRWVLHWLKEGIKIKIFTARACKSEAILYIKKWLLLNGFPSDLEITNIKGVDCDMIFDNNCREVMNNQGIIVSRIKEFNIKKITI